MPKRDNTSQTTASARSDKNLLTHNFSISSFISWPRVEPDLPRRTCPSKAAPGAGQNWDGDEWQKHHAGGESISYKTFGSAPGGPVKADKQYQRQLTLLRDHGSPGARSYAPAQPKSAVP